MVAQTIFTDISQRHIIGNHSIFGEMDVLFLQATRCMYATKCQHCTYWYDNAKSLEQAIRTNKAVIDSVNLTKDTLSISPSASFFDMPMESMYALFAKHTPKNLICESVWDYLPRFKEAEDFIAELSKGQTKFYHKLGLETFDDDVRNALGKNYRIGDTLDDIFKITKNIIILVGFKPQTRETVDRDVKLLLDNAELGEINIVSQEFCYNKGIYDPDIIKYFMDTWYETVKAAPNIEFTADPSTAWQTNINAK